MSKSGLLLQCSWPWGRDVPGDDAGEGARFGSAVHESIQHGDVKKAADKWDLPEEEIEDHCERIRVALWEFLQNTRPEAPIGTDVSDRERLHEFSMALSPARCRKISSPDEDQGHVYHDAGPGELPGTADLIVLPPEQRRPSTRLKSTLIVLDYKTGQGEQSPDSPQMKTLCLAASLWHKTRGKPFLSSLTRVGSVLSVILHAPRETPFVHIYTKLFTPQELMAHHAQLFRALAESHVVPADRALRLGAECHYCPARGQCPAQGGAMALAMLKEADNIDLATPEGIGEVHQRLTELEGKFNAMSRDIRSRLHVALESKGFGARPDGKYVELIEREYETISKGKIVEVEGKAQAEREFTKLRAKGWLTSESRTEMRATTKE